MIVYTSLARQTWLRALRWSGWYLKPQGRFQGAKQFALPFAPSAVQMERIVRVNEEAGKLLVAMAH